MKKISIHIILVAVGCMLFSSLALAGEKKDDGFVVFQKELKKAVQSGNYELVAYRFMVDDFHWALDEIITKQEAIQNVTDILKWDVVKKALSTKAKPIIDAECGKGRCYQIWHKGMIAALIFKKDENDIWHWTGAIGD